MIAKGVIMSPRTCVSVFMSYSDSGAQGFKPPALPQKLDQTVTASPSPHIHHGTTPELLRILKPSVKMRKEPRTHSQHAPPHSMSSQWLSEELVSSQGTWQFSPVELGEEMGKEGFVRNVITAM